MSSLTRRQLLTMGRHLRVGSSLETSTPLINPRTAWADDRPPLGPLPEEDVRFLIVHHSASNNGHTTAEVPRILRGFYDFHTSEARGWDDIAYNFLIDGDGGIWEGRSGSLAGPVAGDATGGNQGFTQLVCLIGNFDELPPTEAAMESLVQLLAWLADRYEVPTSPGSQVSFTSKGSNRHGEGSEVTTPTITGHRTMSQTSCPGEHLDAYVVSGLMADVETLRASTIGSTVVSSSSSSTTSTTTFRVSSTSATAGSVPPSTTLPVAAESDGGVATTWTAGLAAVLLTVGGLLVWRRRRMTGGEPPGH